MGEKELRCKASTDANKLAYSIFSAYQDNSETTIRIRVVGAGALNQAMKGIIISNKYLIKKGVIADVRPSFFDTPEGVTAIDLKIIFAKV